MPGLLTGSVVVAAVFALPGAAGVNATTCWLWSGPLAVPVWVIKVSVAERDPGLLSPHRKDLSFFYSYSPASRPAIIGCGVMGHLSTWMGMFLQTFCCSSMRNVPFNQQLSVSPEKVRGGITVVVRRTHVVHVLGGHVGVGADDGS